MARKKKKLVKKTGIKDSHILDLVAIVKSRGRIKKQKMNDAYEEIERRLKSKMMPIVSQFYIPGCNRDDIYQEALFALRFKAIPDYNKDKAGKFGLYPFDKFAALCIRRHLSTLLKSSFQNKRKALNTSLSLDQDRNVSSDDMLFLIDIIPKTEGNILEFVSENEYYRNLFLKLDEKLSKFERIVFKLYIQKYSYVEMKKIINNGYKKKKLKKRIKIKSIDNALSRIKIKSKEVYQKYKE